MLTLSVTEFSQKIKAMLDLVEFEGEEIVLVRNKHKIARIVPGSPPSHGHRGNVGPIPRPA